MSNEDILDLAVITLEIKCHCSNLTQAAKIIEIF